MNELYKPASLVGVAFCLFAVLIGAFGAHALQTMLLENNRVDTFQLANRYQFYHGLALLVLSMLGNSIFSAKLMWMVTLLMSLGVVIFSGSLYVLAISNTTWLGAITPIGGTLLILSWAVCLIAIMGKRQP